MSSSDYVWKRTHVPTIHGTFRTLATDKTGSILYGFQSFFNVDNNLPNYTDLKNIVISKDGGKTWSLCNLPKISYIKRIACNEKGNKVVILGCINEYLETNRFILISDDYGATFSFVSSLPTNSNPNDIACDNSGDFLVVYCYKLNNLVDIYISTNFGSSWKRQEQDNLSNNKNITSLICYNDETNDKCAAFTTYDGYVYIYKLSTNTWYEQTNLILLNGTWNCICANANGSFLAVCGFDYDNNTGLVYFYNGSSWSTNQLPILDISFEFIACNGSGNQIMLIGNVDQLYVYEENTWINQSDVFDPTTEIFNVVSNRYNANQTIFYMYGMDTKNQQNNGIIYSYVNNKWINLSDHSMTMNIIHTVVSNANGDQLIGLNNCRYENKNLYKYNNHDQAWINTHFKYYSQYIISNDSGNQIINATNPEHGSTNNLYISHDYGAMFVETKINSDAYNNNVLINDFANNGDGRVIAVTFIQTGINKQFDSVSVSKDHGTTWKQYSEVFPNTINLRSICVNQDGNIMYVTSANNGLYISNDTGSTWTLCNNGLPIMNWTAITCDETGNHVAVLGYHDENTILSTIFLYVSNDKGQTWYLSSFIPNCYSYDSIGYLFVNINPKLVVMNKKGNKILFTYTNETGSYIRLSTDYGNSWTTQTNGLPSDTIFCSIAMNSSGDELYACCLGLENNGGVFICSISEPQPPQPPQPPISNICFAAGTLILTDQGYKPIEKIDPSTNTMNGGENIKTITKTRSEMPFWVSIKKDALDKNIPFEKTRISAYHRIFHEGEWVSACELVERGLKGVKKIVYHDEAMYNVLLEKHSSMIANGLTTETLNPRSQIAKYFTKPKQEVTRKAEW